MSRKLTILLLFVLIPLGLSTKFYYGPLQPWVHAYAGDIFYPMFWFFLLRLCWRRLSLSWCAFIVFLFCASVEFLQLCDLSCLDPVRSNLFGAALLGSNFEWADMVYYAIGTGVAVAIEVLLPDTLRVSGRFT